MQLVTTPTTNQTLTDIVKGFNQLAELLSLTLGPRQGTILSSVGGLKPEILTEAGVIARQVTDIPDRKQNVGVMILRHLAWTMHEEYGDGAATASALAQVMINEAQRRIAGGANPMLIRRGMERATAAACAALEEQARPIKGRKALAVLARHITGHDALGDMLGEMFDFLGAQGTFVIDEFAGTYLDREYIDGGRWTARAGARDLMPPAKANLTLDDAVVFVVDEELKDIHQVRGALEIVRQLPGKPPLLIIAREITGEARQMLALNHRQGTVNLGLAVIATLRGDKSEDLSDIALMTGSTLYHTAAGNPPSHVQAQGLGRVKRATLTYEHLTLVKGDGERAAIQQRISDLRSRSKKLDRTEDAYHWLRMRIARLSGGVGVLKVGAYTPLEREAIKEKAKNAAHVLQRAMESGVVPGGGVAYIRCEAAVAAVRDDCATAGEKMGVDVVHAALSAPFLRLIRNASSVHPPIALDHLRAAGADHIYDVVQDAVVPQQAANLYDSLAVIQGALTTAVSAATSAITTERIVFSKSPRTTLKP